MRLAYCAKHRSERNHIDYPAPTLPLHRRNDTLATMHRAFEIDSQHQGPIFTRECHERLFLNHRSIIDQNIYALKPCHQPLHCLGDTVRVFESHAECPGLPASSFNSVHYMLCRFTSHMICQGYTSPGLRQSEGDTTPYPPRAPSNESRLADERCHIGNFMRIGSLPSHPSAAAAIPANSSFRPCARSISSTTVPT